MFYSKFYLFHSAWKVLLTLIVNFIKLCRFDQFEPVLEPENGYKLNSTEGTISMHCTLYGFASQFEEVVIKLYSTYLLRIQPEKSCFNL